MIDAQDVCILQYAVKDLTAEIKSLKEELAMLKMAFSMHVNLCMDEPLEDKDHHTR